MKNLSLNNIQVTDSFWRGYMDLVTREIIPYQLKILHDELPDTPESHCIANLRIAAGLEEGTFKGFVCQDTDLAKWLEAVAYSLSYDKNEQLEAKADELIGLIGMAQEKNGYLNTHFSILHPGRQFCNLKEGHELYTTGHLIEAAVAYYQVTGKRRFLDIMSANADLICDVFLEDPEYSDAVPGHEEIELALVKLANVTGNERYRKMALEFVDRRGTTDYLSREHTLDRYVDVWHDPNPYHPPYGQAHLPVREQETAEGHAVRALYLYSAMADLAGDFCDEGLLNACKKLYNNIVEKRMYVTGSVGSSGVLERFTTDYDLPNDSNYSESCASIALAMFCRRMAMVTGEAKYMDTAELALMNTVLAGVAMDGKSFFYVNPLEVVPAACMEATDKAHVKAQRQKWFGCACCPPNIARTLASLGDYIYFADDNNVWLNLFVSSRCSLSLGGVPAELEVSSELPYNGKVRITLRAEGALAEDCTLRVRIPDYAEQPVFTSGTGTIDAVVEKGYAVIPVGGEELTVEMCFSMPARLIFASPHLHCDNGKCAVKKGPLVYCLEQVDNGTDLSALVLDPSEPLAERFESSTLGGTVVVEAKGFRLDSDSFGASLYSTRRPERKECSLRFTPYFAWGNRSPGEEMAVWVRYKM